MHLSKCQPKHTECLLCPRPSAPARREAVLPTPIPHLWSSQMCYLQLQRGDQSNESSTPWGQIACRISQRVGWTGSRWWAQQKSCSVSCSWATCPFQSNSKPTSSSMFIHLDRSYLLEVKNTTLGPGCLGLNPCPPVYLWDFGQSLTSAWLNILLCKMGTLTVPAS